jgi:hypothetical protein
MYSLKSGGFLKILCFVEFANGKCPKALNLQQKNVQNFTTVHIIISLKNKAAHNREYAILPRSLKMG